MLRLERMKTKGRKDRKKRRKNERKIDTKKEKGSKMNGISSLMSKFSPSCLFRKYLPKPFRLAVKLGGSYSSPKLSFLVFLQVLQELCWLRCLSWFRCVNLISLSQRKRRTADSVIFTLFFASWFISNFLNRLGI